MTSIENGLLRAIAYADVFDFGLTKSELARRIIGKKYIDPKAVSKSLDLLLEQRRVEVRGDYVFFPGRNEVVHLRKTRLKPTTEKYLKAKRMAELLGKIPLVEGVFVTGTVAADNADDGDDIDLMIISRTNWLWTTRLLITVLVELMGKRRRPGQTEIKNTFCINLYLDEAGMEVPVTMRSIYTAHEVILAKCLFERNNVAARFLRTNRWIKDYLPNWVIKSQRDGIIKRGGSWLEQSLYWVQKTYMSRKITKELITKRSAFFHPSDTAWVVIKKYQQKLRQYGIRE
jgi:hypothetical protein